MYEIYINVKLYFMFYYIFDIIYFFKVFYILYYTFLFYI